MVLMIGSCLELVSIYRRPGVRILNLEDVLRRHALVKIAVGEYAAWPARKELFEPAADEWPVGLVLDAVNQPIQKLFELDYRLHELYGWPLAHLNVAHPHHSVVR